jgi:hypothetical protein
MHIKEISNNQDYIFISHSSADKQIMTYFLEDVLVNGLSFPKEQVFFSSNPSTSIRTGEDIPDELKNALNKMTLFIQYISKTYKDSEVCLNEMGAAWYKLQKSKIIIIKAPGISFNEVGFLNIQRIGLNINDKNDLLKLYDDYSSFFPNCKQTDLHRKIDNFLTKI